jgi:hypothetical protein
MHHNNTQLKQYETTGAMMATRYLLTNIILAIRTSLGELGHPLRPLHLLDLHGIRLLLLLLVLLFFSTPTGTKLPLQILLRCVDSIIHVWNPLSEELSSCVAELLRESKAARGPALTLYRPDVCFYTPVIEQ